MLDVQVHLIISDKLKKNLYNKVFDNKCFNRTFEKEVEYKMNRQWSRWST